MSVEDQGGRNGPQGTGMPREEGGSAIQVPWTCQNELEGEGGTPR